MMFLNNLMNSRNLTRAELSASSNIPESTLRDILNGKAQLDRCEAVTLYNLAYALDVSVEDLLEDYWEELALWRSSTESTRMSGSSVSMTMGNTAVRCSWLVSWITCAERMASGRLPAITSIGSLGWTALSIP